ncbi:ATPase [Rhodobacteraceae bacterium KMM 6894]|nr:ATPase [Rhodobacteraceae bacterium KMM 6894]
MSDWATKRFWKEAQVTSVEDGFGVALDERPLRTPAKAPLIVPTRALAEAIATEWDAQTERVDPGTMPVTRSANAAIDKVAVQHGEVADMIADYGDSDLLCYRADSPVELVAEQAAAWDPMLAWCDSFYAAPLTQLTGLMHRPQAPESLRILREAVHAQDNYGLTALHDLVSLSGSLVLGLAALQDDQDIDYLWKLSRLDEEWQARLWGVDDEATELAARKCAAFLHARRFFCLSRA